MSSSKSKITSIISDASFRKFYRLKSKKNTKIIVYVQHEKYRNLIVYAAVNKYLRDNGILTPKLLDYDYEKNLFTIEDFGDLSFYKILSKKKNKLKIYKKLVDTLLKIQKIKIKKKLKTINKKTYILSKYSHKYLHEESDLFFDWYLPLFMNKKKAKMIKFKARKFLTKLYNRLNFSNSIFVHRDYHVSNLIKVRDRVGVIDAQDALIGNPAYDLLSLIDDVRLKTSKKLKNEIFKYYLSKCSKNYYSKIDKFKEDFDILSVQRSLKIIGVFSRLFKRDKKFKYLKLIPYTWRLLQLRLKNKIFNELELILNKSVPLKIRKRINFNEN